MKPTDRKRLTKIRAWVDALLDADAALSEPAPEQPEAVDLAKFRTSQRNVVLAGGGEKAALLGTLSTEPTVTAGAIDKVLGAGMGAERDRLRSAAKALDAKLSKPLER